eukprot:gnl/TRDRNA2_/TRDRNA2_179777_c0_seq1.p1 gnl/TRDRNA2_/TRDRNA2_179777_c0~~gnl/TRDRNA2_/TRDRNA2_179777_c0_seq1.p1  ORF type:complete len:255 (-),score=61.49 gnl/TRDRNA2_/TRDRNA2_179777_c0_seq1:9-773(-)
MGNVSCTDSTACCSTGCADETAQCIAAASRGRPPRWCNKEGDPVDEVAMANLHLLRSAADGDLNGVNEAIKIGADLETRRPLIMRPEDKHTDLQGKGADEEKEETVYLADEGVFYTQGLNPEDEERLPGLTALMRAAKEGHPKIVSLLLTAKASVNAKDEDGMQAIHFAAAAGCMDSCKALIGKGASAVLKDDNGRSAFECLPRDCTITRAERQLWEKVLVKETPAKEAEAAGANSKAAAGGKQNVIDLVQLDA